MKKFAKKRGWIFPVALLVYALLALIAIAFGLRWLWNYADAYQKSRPNTVVETYVEKLDGAYVADRCEDLLAKVDPAQTEQECRQVILQALTDSFTCAKKVSESSENHFVYTIRCGAKVIGTMEMERTEEGNQGLGLWKIGKESFDLSYLLTEPVSLTVPHNYTVQVFGKPLDTSYITKENIPYPLLQDFYKDYSMPYMVTYTAGPFLGPGELTALDTNGNAVELDSDTDMNSFLANCTQEEMDKLTDIAESFVGAYIDYTSRNGGNTGANYSKLCKYMVKDGVLAKRMKDAMESFMWIDDRHGKLLNLDIHHYVNIGEGRYFCHLTYEMESDTLYDRETKSVSAQMIFVETDNGLMTETMRIL